MFPTIFLLPGCLPCTAGSFADTEGLLTCKPCPNGTQQDQNGQSFCPPAHLTLVLKVSWLVLLMLYIPEKKHGNLENIYKPIDFSGSMSVFGGLAPFAGPFQHQILRLSVF